MTRTKDWTAAWKRHYAKRDEMFEWAREHGQIDECLAGMTAARSIGDPVAPEDVALVDRIADETLPGPRK